jgi:hypothetical protein
MAFVALEKEYRFYMVSNEDTFYIKFVALSEICNFIVLCFYILSR